MKFTRSISRKISRRARPFKSRHCPKARRWKLKSWRTFKFSVAADVRRLKPNGSSESLLTSAPTTIMKPKKTWREKLADDKDLPKIGEAGGKLSKRWGEGRFVIPAPREVDALGSRFPKAAVSPSTTC